MLIQGQRDSLTIGGRVLTDLTNLITLKGYVNGAGSGNSGLVDLTGGARVVTATKKFKVIGFRVFGTVAGYFALGYCNNALGISTATAPVAPNESYFGAVPFNAVLNTSSDFLVDFEIPAGKYLYLSNGATATVAVLQLFGYEVPA